MINAFIISYRLLNDKDDLKLKSLLTKEAVINLLKRRNFMRTAK